MIKFLIPIAAVAAAGLACAPMPARADFSACESALQAKDVHQQIALYSSCLKRGGLVATDIAGAFNNRGVDYRRIGDTDAALQDFTSSIQYDPNWPTAYVNRSYIEASRGKCEEALADLRMAAKLAPRHPDVMAAKERVSAACPEAPKP